MYIFNNALWCNQIQPVTSYMNWNYTCMFYHEYSIYKSNFVRMSQKWSIKNLIWLKHMKNLPFTIRTSSMKLDCCLNTKLLCVYSARSTTLDISTVWNWCLGNASNFIKPHFRIYISIILTSLKSSWCRFYHYNLQIYNDEW